MGKVTKPFWWHQNLVNKGCLPLPWGYIHVEKHKKMCIKSEFKEICLKLATNSWSDEGFLLTSKICPQGVFCPCPGAIYMYKIIKNVYKTRFRRDHFETCNIWAKRKGLSFVIKFLFPMGCLYICENTHIKNGKKNQTSKRLFLNWHQSFVPKGLSVPALGLYACIKSFKMCLKSYFKEIML